jgi:hypothetical protein
VNILFCGSLITILICVIALFWEIVFGGWDTALCGAFMMAFSVLVWDYCDKKGFVSL